MYTCEQIEHNRSFTLFAWPQVADFGLSRVCDDAQINTKTYGTVTHMPPELLLDGRLSKSADVYAYGVLLFELFTADRPWSGLRHAEVLHKVAVNKERLQLPDDAPELFKVSRNLWCHMSIDQTMAFATMRAEIRELTGMLQWFGS